MKFITVDTYEKMSRHAANIISAQVIIKPDCVLGLATGSSPLGTYKQLIDWYNKGDIDFSGVTSVNLDEYVGLDGKNEQSYRYFMDKNLFDSINIDKANTHVMNGKCEDPEKETADYDKAIEAAGGIDIQVLGIGRNGHIGFNEPADELIAATHLTGLTESTIEANARFFEKESDVPRHALTMGMKPIMAARQIIILINGKNKHEALMGLLSGKISTSNPSTMLNLHGNVTILCDEEAYNG